MQSSKISLMLEILPICFLFDWSGQFCITIFWNKYVKVGHFVLKICTLEVFSKEYKTKKFLLLLLLHLRISILHNKCMLDHIINELYIWLMILSTRTGSNMVYTTYFWLSLNFVLGASKYEKKEKWNNAMLKYLLVWRGLPHTLTFWDGVQTSIPLYKPYWPEYYSLGHQPSRPELHVEFSDSVFLLLYVRAASKGGTGGKSPLKVFQKRENRKMWGIFMHQSYWNELFCYL